MAHKSYPAFNYTPLQPGYIRVLQPATELNGDLTWTMDAIPLAQDGHPDDNPFDALSYTWGDQSQTFPLICNNQEFRIHHNLRSALPYIAKRGSSRPIWIDALSINQEDGKEKASQIKLMHRVYRQATKVWLWFGCATEQTLEAIAILTRLHFAFTVMDDSFVWPTFQSLGFPGSDSPVWEEVFEFLGNEWFGRVWVIQEAALATEIGVLRGSYEIDWSTLSDLAWSLPRLAFFRDHINFGTQNREGGNEKVDVEAVSGQFPIDFVSAFLRNDRSILSSYDLLVHLPFLQSEQGRELLKLVPELLVDDLHLLWSMYWATIGCDWDTFVEDLICFLFPGRRNRRRSYLGALDLIPGSAISYIRNNSHDPVVYIPDHPNPALGDMPFSVPGGAPISVSGDIHTCIQDCYLRQMMSSKTSQYGRYGYRDFMQDVERLLPTVEKKERSVILKDILAEAPGSKNLYLRLDINRLFKTIVMVNMAEMGRTKQRDNFTQSRSFDLRPVVWKVLDIVWLMVGSQACSDPRDRVFATFGFFGESLPSEFSRFHEMGLDELYSKFCQYLLLESSRVPPGPNTMWWATLHYATLAGKRKSLPSWCTDFHQEFKNKRELYDTMSAREPMFKAGTRRSAMMERGIDWNEIRLRGRIFDSVSAVHPAMPLKSDFEGLQLAVAPSTRVDIYRLAVWESDLATRVLGASSGGLSNPNMFKVYWQTLIGDSTAPLLPPVGPDDFREFQSGIQRIRKLFDKLGIIERLEDGTLVENDGRLALMTIEELDDYKFITMSLTSPSHTLYSTLQSRLSGRALFSTASGRFGFGGESVEKGDILCIFNGAPSAHLIRRKHGGRPGADVYQLIGEAFVHGMMDGEIEDLDVEEQDINLV